MQSKESFMCEGPPNMQSIECISKTVKI